MSTRVYHTFFKRLGFYVSERIDSFPPRALRIEPGMLSVVPNALSVEAGAHPYFSSTRSDAKPIIKVPESVSKGRIEVTNRGDYFFV